MIPKVQEVSARPLGWRQHVRSREADLRECLWEMAMQAGRSPGIPRWVGFLDMEAGRFARKIGAAPFRANPQQTLSEESGACFVA